MRRAEKKTGHKASMRARILLKGLFVENPLFVMLLGTCPSLATTKSVEAALGMGILFLLVLVCSNVLISLLRKIIPEDIRIPCYIVIIASFVTIVKLMCNAFLPELYRTLGVFISLIVVNCIVLGRAEAFAGKNTVGDSFLDGLGMGLGYAMALLLLSFIRELLGTGGFAFGHIFTFLHKTEWRPFAHHALRFFKMPAGAFIVLGTILAIIAAIRNRRDHLLKSKERALKLKAIEEKKKAEALLIDKNAPGGTR